MLILLIEDNQKLAQNIATILQSEGYHVDRAEDVAMAKEAVETKSYDLIILDLGLPDGDGIELCQYFRQQNYGWPILTLTARMNLASKVESLDGGADDYLTKPFLTEELLARVRALLRRDSTQKTSQVVINDLKVDLRTKTVSKANQVLKISPIEMKLLEALLLKRGSILTAAELYEKVWGNFETELLFSDTLKVTVARLRKKIGHTIITTVSGSGYGIQ